MWISFLYNVRIFKLPCITIDRIPHFRLSSFISQVIIYSHLEILKFISLIKQTYYLDHSLLFLFITMSRTFYYVPLEKFLTEILQGMFDKLKVKVFILLHCLVRSNYKISSRNNWMDTILVKEVIIWINAINEF